MSAGIRDFAELLPTWREAVGLERSDIDKAIAADPDVQAAIAEGRIKVPARFTSHMENGRLRSPDREVCNVIARVVKLDPAYVWRVSALERIRKAGALDFHNEEIERAKPTGTSTELSEAERFLLEEVRDMQDGAERVARFLGSFRATRLPARSVTPEERHAKAAKYPQLPYRDRREEWFRLFDGEVGEASLILQLVQEIWRTVELYKPGERSNVLMDVLRAQWGIRAQRLADKDEAVARSLEAFELQLEQPASTTGDPDASDERA